MPFLHLFAKGAQVLNAGLSFHLSLKADIFPKSSAWAADFEMTVPSITKACSEVLILNYC